MHQAVEHRNQAEEVMRQVGRGCCQVVRAWRRWQVRMIAGCLVEGKRAHQVGRPQERQWVVRRMVSEQLGVSVDMLVACCLAAQILEYVQSSVQALPAQLELRSFDPLGTWLPSPQSPPDSS